MMYNPRVVHVARKKQSTADALFRAPTCDPDSADVDLINNAAFQPQPARDPKYRKQTTLSIKSEMTTVKVGQHSQHLVYMPEQPSQAVL